MDLEAVGVGLCFSRYHHLGHHSILKCPIVPNYRRVTRPKPLQQMIPHAQCVRDYGEGWIHRAA